jgi:hypothetical protein
MVTLEPGCLSFFGLSLSTPAALIYIHLYLRTFWALFVTIAASKHASCPAMLPKPVSFL